MGPTPRRMFFAGEVDSPVYGQHSLSEITITVTTDSNGNQTLEVKIPASVIPIRTTAVTHNADGSISTSVENAAYPLRILYTVGTRDGVLDANGNVTDMVSEDYIKAHTDPLTGKVAFYSNLYSRNTIDPGGHDRR